MKLSTRLAIATLLSPQAILLGQSAPIAVVVDGAPRTVAASALARLPRDSAPMTFHDQPAVVYSGVSLAAVLREVGVRTDSLRGPALATRLVVEASDGYRVVFALADLDPTLGARRMLLADRLDGKPLSADEAPWRLIIPGDVRPARSARQVVTIRVLAEPK